MINSVGFVILYNKKILLSHPRKQGDNTWGIAKGKVESDETYLDCAIRETREEIGLDININLFPVLFNWNTIVYKNAKNKAYKRLHYFILEIDESRFMTYEEAENKIFWRQKEILNLIK